MDANYVKTGLHIQTIFQCLIWSVRLNTMSWLSEQNSNRTLLIKRFHSKKPELCNYGVDRLIFECHGQDDQKRSVIEPVPCSKNVKFSNLTILITANKKSDAQPTIMNEGCIV
jgi:hypothetical protein